jgi:hypothetical protein
MGGGSHNGKNGKNGKNGNGQNGHDGGSEFKKVKKEVKALLNEMGGVTNVDVEFLKLSQLVHEVWQRRLRGQSTMRIAEEMSLKPQEVVAMIEGAHEALKGDISRMAEVGLYLDLDRIDLLLERWLPIAEKTEHMITAMGQDGPYQTVDFDRPFRALLGCIELIKLRSKNLGYEDVKEGAVSRTQLGILMRYLENSKEAVRQLTQNPD